MSTRITVWGSPPVSTYARRPVPQLPFPLEEPGCRVFSRARHALFAGVRCLGLGPGDDVLAPAYHHGSEIEALVRAGLQCRFFDVGPDLAPDREQVESLVGERTRALLLVHALGRPQDATAWRGWCDARGLLLLEDAAQAWLGAWDGMPLGARGDLSIFCLYKTLPLPDGAAVIGKVPPVPSEPDGGRFVRLARHHAVTTVRESAWLSRLARRARPLRPYEPLRDFALGDPTTPRSTAIDVLLPRLARPDVADRRRANYRWLVEQLGDRVGAPFDTLAPGASPFVFPLVVDPGEKRTVLERLAHHEIDALDFWKIPHPTLPVEHFPRAAALRASVVGLPVHQGLTKRDLRRIVTAISA